MATQSAPGRPKLGMLLVDEKVISLEQLDKALAMQQDRAMRLGQLVVDLGYAQESDVLSVINRRYRLGLSSLDQPWRIGGGASLINRLRHLRVSIRAKLSIAIIFILLITILVLSFVILTRQRENLYQQTVQTGKVSLNYFTNNAKDPLLNNQTLQLIRLVKDAASVEGLLYAVIVDRDNVVQAHTDLNKLRKPLDLPAPNTNLVTREGNYIYYSYQDVKGQQVLDLSGPIAYQDKRLGEVHVGVSLDFISRQIRKESITVLALSSGIILLGVVIAIFLGIGFSRPISALVVGTREIGKGNLKYKIDHRSNDELGDLAQAFNYMSAELWKKQLMQESFGKYVGSDILQMIMANPESQWLKGSRNNASVLFTDIRGFTSYSENREPEQVVEALNQYFEIASRIILEYGGYVDKFIGDAVMGVFGVPVPQEYHAEQCVRAALHMQNEFADAAKRTGNEVLAKVGIGINSGVLVAGNLGSQVKMEYTVIGDTVNIASRLNGLAAAGETVISLSTLQPIASVFKVEEMEPQKVKGKAEKLQVFRVIGFKEGKSHVQDRTHPQRPSA
jgi:adenylate cyclase